MDQGLLPDESGNRRWYGLLQGHVVKNPYVCCHESNDVPQMPTDGKQPAVSTRFRLSASAPHRFPTLEELTLLFDNLPAEISFIDKDDTVRFSSTPDPPPFSPRPKAAWARTCGLSPTKTPATHDRATAR
jgi:hypothetical protein